MSVKLKIRTGKVWLVNLFGPRMKLVLRPIPFLIPPFAVLRRKTATLPGSVGPERRLSAVLHLPATADGSRRLLWRRLAAILPLSAWNTRLVSANDDSLEKHECSAPSHNINPLSDRRTLALQDMVISSYGGHISGVFSLYFTHTKKIF